jgi:hypothetical protein
MPGAQCIWGTQLALQHVAVQEKEGTERLILYRGSHVLVGGQVGEKGFDLASAQILGVALVVKQDRALDPAYVGLFSAVGTVSQAQGVAYLV